VRSHERTEKGTPPLPLVSSWEFCGDAFMHFFNFHIGDYKSHTSHLTLIEDLAYRRLLDFYYLHENPIKQRDIARQIGMREHEQDVLTVLNEFFLSTDEGFVSPRADKEIAKFKEFSEAGKRGAAKRWGGDKEVISPPNAPPIATNNHKPLTINQEPYIKEGKPSLSGSSFPPCPHSELLKLWEKHLPHLTQPRTWEGNRQANMRQRWVQAGKPSAYSPEGYKTTETGLKWWDSFFGYIANDTSLANGFETKGRTWRPDLEWIVNATNFQKIIDGKYAK
jgi:uncharacterized protein YdaU (DUF1376 family)